MCAYVSLCAHVSWRPEGNWSLGLEFLVVGTCQMCCWGPSSDPSKEQYALWITCHFSGPRFLYFWCFLPRCMWEYHVHRGQKRHLMPWNWSYRQLLADTWTHGCWELAVQDYTRSHTAIIFRSSAQPAGERSWQLGLLIGPWCSFMEGGNGESHGAFTRASNLSIVMCDSALIVRDLGILGEWLAGTCEKELGEGASSIGGHHPCHVQAFRSSCFKASHAPASDCSPIAVTKPNKLFGSPGWAWRNCILVCHWYPGGEVNKRTKSGYWRIGSVVKKHLVLL